MKHLKMEEMVEGRQEVMVVMLVESEVKNDKIQMLIQNPTLLCAMAICLHIIQFNTRTKLFLWTELLIKPLVTELIMCCII